MIRNVNCSVNEKVKCPTLPNVALVDELMLLLGHVAEDTHEMEYEPE